METAITSKLPFIHLKQVLITTVCSLAYLFLSYSLPKVGFKGDAIFLIIVFNVLYYSSRPTRKFITAFCVYIVYWAIFDSMKGFPNYLAAPVHIGSLYANELAMFGIHTAAGVITPNEYFLIHHSVAADVLAGSAYLCWVPVPLLFSVWLFYKHRPLFFHFALTFLLVNFLGFIIYYTFPAAPPWYMHQYGNVFNAHTPGNIAGLAGFDNFFGVHVFQGLYAKSSNVFAAMPSLHCAYPMITVFFTFKVRTNWLWRILAVCIMLGIWFAAIYTSHHYVLDVLVGIGVGALGIGLLQLLVAKSRRFNRFVNGWMALQ